MDSCQNSNQTIEERDRKGKDQKTHRFKLNHNESLRVAVATADKVALRPRIFSTRQSWQDMALDQN
jgi:hypothetical protein